LIPKVTCKARFVKPFIIGDEMKDLVIKRGQVETQIFIFYISFRRPMPLFIEQ
jgi:hypothetical protein